MIKSALWAGIPFKDIGGLTPQEINTAVTVESEKQKDFYRMMAWLVYNNAQLTAVGFHNPKKFPSLEDVFPNLFEHKEQQDWWVIKQRMEDYAAYQKQR